MLQVVPVITGKGRFATGWWSDLSSLSNEQAYSPQQCFVVLAAFVVVILRRVHGLDALNVRMWKIEMFRTQRDQLLVPVKRLQSIRDVRLLCQIGEAVKFNVPMLHGDPGVQVAGSSPSARSSMGFSLLAIR